MPLPVHEIYSRVAPGAPCRWRGSEQDVQLADRLVDLPVAPPAAGEDGGVTGADVLRLAAVRGDRHPPGQDVHRLVGFQGPVGGPRRALPHPDFLVAVGPQRPAGGLHRLPGGLGQRAPVLQVGGDGRGGQERGGRGRVGHGWCTVLISGNRQLLSSACSGAISGNGRATGSAASRLRPLSSNRSRPREVTSTTSEVPVRARSVATRATAGPHIMPAPPALATVTPASGPCGPSAGPMIGR